MHYRVGVVDESPYCFREQVLHCPDPLLSSLPNRNDTNSLSAITASKKCTTHVEWHGLVPELFTLFAATIENFTYTFHQTSDNRTGSLNVTTGKWNGVLGMLQDGKCTLST